MADKQGWPVHAQAAWEHEKRRGDRLYQALCDMERQRDDALRALALWGVAMGSSMESTIENPHSAALLTSEGPAQRPETPTVGTCATCRHWSADEQDNQYGWCAKNIDSSLSGVPDGEFGCVLHEPMPLPDDPKEPTQTCPHGHDLRRVICPHGCRLK